MAEGIVFWFLASGCVISALCVVVPPMGRSPIHAAIALVSTFFFLSGIYVLLAAHLMAALQVIVYAGAVMVLFTFVIMLLNLSDDELGTPRHTTAKWVGVLAISFVFAKAIRAIQAGSTDKLSTDVLAGPDTFGGVKAVGNVLLRDFLLPFELTSVLLLVAVIGAVILARRQAVT